MRAFWKRPFDWGTSGPQHAPTALPCSSHLAWLLTPIFLPRKSTWRRTHSLRPATSPRLTSLIFYIVYSIYIFDNSTEPGLPLSIVCFLSSVTKPPPPLFQAQRMAEWAAEPICCGTSTKLNRFVTCLTAPARVMFVDYFCGYRHLQLCVHVIPSELLDFRKSIHSCCLAWESKRSRFFLMLCHQTSQLVVEET